MAADIQEITGTSAVVAARLSNFSTGSSVPTAAHFDWLKTRVRPAVTNNPTAWVDLLGHASRQWKHTGGMNSHRLNRILSFQRCEAIKSAIADHGSAVHFNVEMAEGDDESFTPNPDDGYDRAVEVYVYAAGPPPRKPSPAAVLSTKFEIRVVGGGSASALLQADNYFFQIVDLTRKVTAFYMYTGGGLGISIPKIPGAGSMTKSGPPTPFTTTRSADLRMFNSTASLYQDAGVTFGTSVNIGGTMRLVIKEVLDTFGLISTRPSMIPISGGWGIQMPGLGSASEGVLALVSDVFPFVGY